MNEEILVRTAVATAANLLAEPIKHVLNTWLKPKLEEMKQKNEVDRKMELFVFEVFSDYLEKTYEYQNSVNIISLGLQQVKLEQIYIPLTIRSEERENTIKVSEYNTDFADKYKKIVIEDTAGMGKSTLMKKLFVSAIEQNVGIPIFIELRNLTKDKDILDVIVEDINSLKPIHNKEFILEVISRGNFIFFLDGYDEIPFQHKQDITKHLKQFIKDANNNIFFLTSRLDDSLSSFGQFQKFEILDLKKSESFELIKKYDSITQLNLSSTIIKQIEDNIEGGRFSDLESFLGNPLLVSFLYLTFKHKKDIPAMKIDFYRKVYDALFELHDLSKDSFKRDKYSGISSRKLQKILMKLGYLCLRANQNDYDKDKLLGLISQAKNSPYFKDFQEELILKDLLETVPLFSVLGLNYKWAHKSFMEYFAAYFIEEQDNREKVLQAIYNSGNFPIYLNMLDFYYDINRQLFDKVFVYPLINQFINYIDSSGIDPSVDKEKLLYLESIFNRIIIFDVSGSFKLFDSVQIDEREKKIKEQLRDKLPYIDKYTLKRTSSGIRYFSMLLTNEFRIEHILKLLMSKKSNLVKYIHRDNSVVVEKQDAIFSGDETKVKSMSEVEIKSANALIGNKYGKPADKGRKVLNYTQRSRFEIVLDYFEVLKYKKLIEEEMEINEEDIFLNL
ncbi:hypothetical protein COM95_04215 [Bacillus cereus]|nr:hypothetical protein COM95_04215 [Bacillus cereus]